MRDFLIDHIEKDKKNWVRRPEIHCGPGFQDNLVLIIGEPRTAIFAHMDSVGFTVKNDEELVKIGGPIMEHGIALRGADSQGAVNCTLNVEEGENKKNKILRYDGPRPIDPGTSLTFVPDFRETEEHVQCCYMDNRLGVWNALQVARRIENGAIVFSTWEEHGGGSVSYLARFLYEQYGIDQALISDITWVTDDLPAGHGTAISLRDSGIPRKGFVDRVQAIARSTDIPWQAEVEGAGGSDGIELQRSPYPFDWCFVGAPEENVHSPDEKVHKRDLNAMVRLYEQLMEAL